MLADDAPGTTVLVPGEHVLTLAVALPLPTRRRRLAALPFAIEDQLATPVAGAHVALGAALGGGRYLAGVVERARMEAWLAALEAAGLADAALVPDALALPAPADGAWSVRLADGRAVVRGGDATAFATGEAQFHALWLAAGRPACTAFGAPLPAGIAATPATLDGLAARLTPPPLDLRQGAYARRGDAVPPLVKRAALVAAVTLAAQGAIVAADTVALRAIADTRAQQTHMAAGTAAPGRLLPLLTRAAAALGPTGATLRAVAFDAATDTLALEIETGDRTAAESALAASGLAITHTALTAGRALAITVSGAPR